ncbi:hypothetical protein M3Y99_00877900 [Aphelenchoides fujianensis]|nr:hypothetical protein M3Y99_00877900 [Aphelenchoides fujianensis]
MYSLIHETDSSTAVSHSLCGRFLPGGGRQLVTVSMKTVRMYRLNPCARFIDTEEHNWKQGPQLECIYKADLLAPIRSVAIARVPLCPSVDSLLLAFDEAKISVVNFDNSAHALQTTSLHDFENEDLRDGFTKQTTFPIVRTDPAQRCAAMLMYNKHLSIFPLGETVQGVSSYLLALKTLEARLENVIDMQFLHGYHEPTLFFVYEPIQTTPGRAAIRYDTVNILGVSLNVKDRVHAVVWNLSGLPSTISQCLSFPLPLGGVCLFGSNELVYLNQSVPPCGLALNSDADEYSKFPLNDAKSFCLTLDGCAFDVLGTNEVLIGTRTGVLYTLTLDVDISNSVKQLKLERRLEIPIPYTLTTFGDYIFCVENKVNGEVNGTHEDGDKKEAPAIEDVDEDDVFLYGENDENIKKKEEATGFVRDFKIVDRLWNAAPCKVLRSADATNLSAVFRDQKKDVYFDMVSASGHAKDSRLCFFQRTIRPLVHTSTVVEDAAELFTVGRKEDDTQKYLVIARETTSLIFELLENDMQSVDGHLFVTNETTIAAGELANGSISVQVTASSIVLVGTISDERGDEQIASLHINSNFPVVLASIVDPFIAITIQSGQFLLYRLETEPSVHLRQLPVNSIVDNPEDKSTITAVCVYKDVSGLFKMSSLNDEAEVLRERPLEIKQEFPNCPADRRDGDRRGGRDAVRGRRFEAEKQTKARKEGVLDSDIVSPTHWIVIARESGHMYIYSEDLELVYCVKKGNNLAEVLAHTPLETINIEDAFGEQGDEPADVGAKPDTTTIREDEVIVDLRLTGLGMNQGRPVLSVMLDDTITFYEVFAYDDGFSGSLAIRFCKLPHTVVTRSSHFLSPSGRNRVEAARDASRPKHPRDFNGLFIAGHYPTILCSSHGEFIFHPLIIDGPIASLCAFDNTHCRNGFVYLRLKDCTMRTAWLDPLIHYDTSYPFRETVRYVVYLLHWNIFAIVSTTAVRSNKTCSVMNEDKHFETHERPDTFVWPVMDKYKLQDWNFIPKSEIEFDEFEKRDLLRGGSPQLGSYLALGTAVSYGEEVFVRGRVLIYEIVEVVPEEGQPTTRHRLKCVYDKEQKGPVTSMCHCNGYFLTGMGQKIFIWQFKDGMLNGVSFLDMHYYVHSLIGFRSLALACDMFHSISLVRYQEEYKVLSLASRDLRPSVPAPMAAQFVLDRNQLGFVLSDECGNVSVFNYMPEAPESFGGEHLATWERRSWTMRTARKRIQTILLCTLDGSWAAVRPMNERAFRRLQTLQQLMLTQVPQIAGLNQRGARALKPRRLQVQSGAPNRLYLQLSVSDRTDLARASGSNRYQITDDIIELCRAITHF